MGQIQVKTIRKKFLSKPWFDLDCKFARKKYRKIKRRFKSRETDLLHSELRDAEKKYKNLLNKKFKHYSQNITKNLDSTNPKDFWKLLNKGKRKNQPDIGIDKLFHFFKDLNSDSAGNVYEGQLDMDEGTLEQINSHIK